MTLRELDRRGVGRKDLVTFLAFLEWREDERERARKEEAKQAAIRKAANEK